MKGVTSSLLFLWISFCMGETSCYCAGRICCDRIEPRDRACLLSDTRVNIDAFRMGPGLTKAKSAALALDAFKVSAPLCEDDAPPVPISTNLFGDMQGLAYGDLIVNVDSEDLQPQSPLFELLVVMNRDMDGNLFHALYNSALPLHHAAVSLGSVHMLQNASLAVLDYNSFCPMERELFTALFSAQLDQGRILDRTQLLQRAQSSVVRSTKLLLGTNRHWRTWWHGGDQGYSQSEMYEFSRWVRRSFGIMHEIPWSETQVITLVDRKGTREILNMDELEQALAGTFSVKRVRMEHLTLQQQFQLIANTRVLVGAHGAALAFIPFLARGAGVVEIVPDAHSDPKFFTHLARVSGVRHALHAAPSELQPEWIRNAKAPMQSPIVCGVSQVVEMITSLS